MFPNNLSRFAFLALLLVPITASATMPLSTPADSIWGRPEGSLSPSAARRIRARSPMPLRDLREILGQFRQTCTFLDSMQDHDPESGVFGGLHEGEGDQLWAIIETDNTQEAIRVWCEYADYFADPDRFRANVEDAWTYCDSFPAWDESAPNEFYAMHNAGWGLIATIGYRRVYGDDRDEYGRRCAEHLIENVPEITPNMQDNLMPLVAGWSAGTLYEYGWAMDNRDYQLEAVRIAEEVKEWIESNPDRLSRNEIWALCGGTAMWGVIRTLAREDTTAAEWMPNLLENMDVLAGRGNWNNSWNIWYAHAWLSAYEFFGDEDYLHNAETILDSLLVQDTDDDGGLPATIGDPDNRDQAWVSAYTAWMGLRNLFEGIPEVDVALLDVLSPANNRPWPIGEELEFVLKVQQNGARELIEDVPLRITGDWNSNQTFDLQGWEPQSVPLELRWRPERAGHAVLTFIAGHVDDSDRSNDTILHRFDIRPAAPVEVIIQDTSGNPVGGQVVFSSDEFPNEIPPSVLNMPDNEIGASIFLMQGTYKAHLYPNFPYAEEVRANLAIVGDGSDVVIFTSIHPPLLIIDADTDSTNFEYYANTLSEINIPFRRWRIDLEGNALGKSDGFQSLLYFTGDRIENLISEVDQTEMGGALESGISVLVTGQNIAADLAGTDFLQNRLHSRFLTDNTRSRQVLGLASDELMDGMRLLLLGNQGAGNQSSTDGIAATGNGIACALYSDRGDTAGMVRWTEESGARGLFCSFGVEAISGAGGTTSREEFLRRALTWLGVDLAVDREIIAPLPASPLLIIGYPNPFNSSINLHLSENLRSRQVGLSIWDIGGKQVALIGGGVGGKYVWNGDDLFGALVSAGNYFVTMDRMNSSSAVPPALQITLVR